MYVCMYGWMYVSVYRVCMKLVLGSSFLKRIVQNANIFFGGETLSVDPSQRAAAIFRVCKAIFFLFIFMGIRREGAKLCRQVL